MKKQTIKKLFAFILLLSGMFSFTFVNAQTCNGNKIRVYKCMRSGYCSSKCVSPNNIPAGWGPFCAGCTYGFRQAESMSTDESSLTDVYPNPVSNSTTITFSLSQSEKVSLKVFDVNGRLVSTLADKVFEEGENELVWNASDVNAGVYFLQFQSADILQTEKLIVTK